MQNVTVFLRAPLFTLPHGAGHVPAGTTILEAEVVDKVSGGLTLATKRLLGERGDVLAESTLTLIVPWAKIDHVQVHGD
jgi:hypothetical protein